jgi:multiple sugar transport system permease protein
VALIGCAIFITPFLWLISTSVKEEDEMVKFPPVWIPTRQVMVDYNGKKCGLSTMDVHGRKTQVVEVADLEDGSKDVVVRDGQIGAGQKFRVTPDQLSKIRRFGLKWENYRRALEFLPKESKNGVVYLWNTVFITVMCIIGTLLSCAISAFSFARLRWPGRDTLFGVFLATMMIPAAVTMAPVFLIFRKLGMDDTLYPLWITSFLGAPFAIFLLRQFFMTVPDEYAEAARIDGASELRIYSKIYLPLIAPALVTLGIFGFQGSWNSFMWPNLILANAGDRMTLTMALQQFVTSNNLKYGPMMAVSFIISLPILILFIAAQKYFIKGVAITSK